MAKWVVVGLLVAWLCVMAGALVAKAQETLVSPSVERVGAGAMRETAPVVPDEAKRLLFDLQQQFAGYARSIAVLQEKQDGVSGEYQRTIQRLQKDGWTLDVQTMAYTKAEPPKPAEKKP